MKPRLEQEAAEVAEGFFLCVLCDLLFKSPCPICRQSTHEAKACSGGRCTQSIHWSEHVAKHAREISFAASKRDAPFVVRP